ncbi:MAG TPA: glycosyltransferase [Acidobacteriaceae bacterium]|nr:glycosyltransferase [Acidobacteriaceae bacterium]
MESSTASVGVVVPTLNAAKVWPFFHRALAAQTIRPTRVLIVDSSSTDETQNFAKAAGYQVLSVAREEFNHGGTRQMAVNMLSDVEIVVFLTQDAVLAESTALLKLIEAMRSPEVGAAYGRQLPRHGAAPIEAHARLFNYPPVSGLRKLSSRDQLGFKAIFFSNSFAVYRRAALMKIGGFPSDAIFGEDTITAARLLLANWDIAYVADAQVYHSHSYTWKQEFKRYFDIGVLHSREGWLLRDFGQTRSEGRRFVISEMKYLIPRYWWLAPSALIRTGLKLVGYRLGRREKGLSSTTKRRLSMQPSFWK